MKLAFYVGPGNIGDKLVRLRLRSPISHCELVFEPGDGVDELMPDHTCAPAQGDGALWCASSTGADRIPPWCSRRSGRRGGVRFRRIDVGSGRWLLLDLPWMTQQQKIVAATWFTQQQGALYDWQAVLGFIAWPISQKDARWNCHEACATALGMSNAHRLDPAALFYVVVWAAGFILHAWGED